MRKILLGTTAVVGAALLSNVAQAQTAPTVRVGGYFEFTGAYVDDSADRNAVATGTQLRNRDKIDFRTDAEIVVIVGGKAANGLSYGAQVELQIDNFIPQANTTAGTGVDTDEAWGFVSSPTLGTLQFGDQDSAASQMAVSLPGAVAQLGMSSQWDEFVAQNADFTRYLVADINDGNDSTKIIYMSPQFFGFDFGVSFAPNGREGEEFRSNVSNIAPSTQILQRDPNDNNSIRNELSGAIRYRGSFGNIGVQAGLAAHRADAQAVAPTAAQLQDVSEYQAGLQLTGFGLTVGGMYRWGKYGFTTRIPIRQGLANSTTWGIGATYVTGAIAVGGFYAKAERDNGGALADRTQTVWGLGASYTLAPGMDLFANYTNISDRNIANSFSNPTALSAAGNGNLGRNRDIDVFVVGTRLTF